MTSEYKQAVSFTLKKKKINMKFFKTKRQQELMAVYNTVIKDKNEIISNQINENRNLQYEISDVWRKYDECKSVILNQSNTINRLNVQIDTQTRIIER
jgi:hypothetical protein